MAFRKNGAVEQTTSVYNPKTGKTSVPCPQCGTMDVSAMTRQAFKDGENQKHNCSNCSFCFSI